MLARQKWRATLTVPAGGQAPLRGLLEVPARLRRVLWDVHALQRSREGQARACMCINRAVPRLSQPLPLHQLRISSHH